MTLFEVPAGLRFFAGVLSLLAMMNLCVLEAALFYFRKIKYILFNSVILLIHFVPTVTIIIFRYAAEEGDISIIKDSLIPGPIAQLPAVSYIVYSLLVCVVSLLSEYGLYKNLKNNISRVSIAESINNLSDGYCVFTENGEVILINRVMENLCFELTGEYPRNITRVTEKLSGMPLDITDKNNRGMRLSGAGFGGDLAVRTENGTVWEFRGKEMEEGESYAELIAHNITELFRITDALYKKNEELGKAQEQLKETLQNVEKTEQELETLKLKMRIHEQFGQTILFGQQFIKPMGPETVGCVEDALDRWEETLRGFTNTFSGSSKQDVEAELSHLAENLNCRLLISDEHGNRTDLKDVPTVVMDVIREGLINAVRHGQATRLTVVKRKNAKGIRSYMVADNGVKKKDTEVKEGGGLGSARRRIERAGGRLTVLTQSGVKLLIEMP